MSNLSILGYKLQSSKLGFYMLFNGQGHIGTGSRHCHLWESNPHIGDSL